MGNFTSLCTNINCHFTLAVGPSTLPDKILGIDYTILTLYKANKQLTISIEDLSYYTVKPVMGGPILE